MTKEELYKSIQPQVESLLEGDMIADMANLSSILHSTFGFWWTGFYRVCGNELVLGPFQGPVACTRIPFGKGVCGAAWKAGETIIVPDVDKFPGHIACSSESRSEIVVPVRKDNEIVAVLDIDSRELSRFDEIDRKYLEIIMERYGRVPLPDMRGNDMKDTITEEGKWKILKSEYLYERPWLTVRRDCVQIPGGQINDEFYVLEYPDWVNVIAITDDGQFVLERQYRHGFGKTCYEIPAGVIDEGESPLEAAKRELLEETGYGEGQWHEMMTLSGNTSTTDNLSHCFIATNVRKISKEQHLDRTEDITVTLLTRNQVLDLMVNDQIKQALMAAPLWRYFAEQFVGKW